MDWAQIKYESKLNPVRDVNIPCQKLKIDLRSFRDVYLIEVGFLKEYSIQLSIANLIIQHLIFVHYAKKHQNTYQAEITFFVQSHILEQDGSIVFYKYLHYYKKVN